ncbi:MAG: hypothetical protein C0402_02735 [Thermodesulfovibrio sp.]|nr:hypothetical protein [Thermodesulfovibrio sp.]
MSRKNDVLLKIRRISDLPTMADTIDLINKLKTVEDSTISELTNIILKDYSLTTKLLKVVNSVHYSQSGEVTTVSRAIFLMGIEHVKNIALTLMLFDNLKKNSAYATVVDVIVQALWSGIIAQKLVRDLNFVEEEEAFICALLHPLGKILVAYSMPETIAEIKELSIQQGVTEEQAAVSILEISFEEIGTTIAAEWNYPQAIVQSMRNTHCDELGVAGAGLHEKLSLVATLSNDVSNALAADMGREEKTAKIKQLLGSGKTHLKVKDSLGDMLKTSAESLSDLAGSLNLDVNKSRFCRNLEDLSETQASPRTDEDVLEFKTDALKTIDTLFQQDGNEENPESIFSRGIQDINNSMLQPYSLNDIIQIALETMYRGMKNVRITRALFFVRNPGRPLLEVRLGFGADIEKIKKLLVFAVGTSKDIFNLAIAQDSDLIIKDSHSPEIRRFIPACYRDAVPAAVYIILLPISINKKNIGLFCLEGQQQGFGDISKEYFNYLRILRDQTVLAIRQLSNTK